jgi:hypothetical protein
VNQWLITVSQIDELSKCANIIYESQYTNLIGVESDLTKEELLSLDGVITVEEAATGRFY